MHRSEPVLRRPAGLSNPHREVVLDVGRPTTSALAECVRIFPKNNVQRRKPATIRSDERRWQSAGTKLPNAVGMITMV